MNRPRLVRALRIAWTAFWGLAAILLITLWVRSYTTPDVLQGPLTSAKYFNVACVDGDLGLSIMEGITGYATLHFDSIPTLVSEPSFFAHPQNFTRGGFKYLKQGGFLFVVAPFWFPVLIVAALAASPWRRRISWRFSLRTLLIAMTLIAVGLGIVAWLSH
jgi:hypothetical protein